MSIFDSLLEPTFILNGNKEIVYLNEPGALLVGMTTRKIKREKLNWVSAFTFSEPLKSFEDLQNIQESLAYQEVTFTSCQGVAGRVQITCQRVHISEEPLWLVYMRDVTLEETLQRKYRKEIEQKENYISKLEQAQNQLEDYSRNLEQKVIERTRELAEINQNLKALVDSLGQGFFIFNKEGLILNIASNSCLQIFGKDPKGSMIWDIFKLDNKEKINFQKWMTTLFSEMLPFEDLAPLGPQGFKNDEGRTVDLKYYPLKNDEESLSGVVVVATDITELIKAQNEAKKEKSTAQLILKLTRDEKHFKMFYQDAKSLIEQLQLETLKKEIDKENTLRVLHTLKGGALSFSLLEISESCHEAEEFILNGDQSLEVLKKSVTKIQNNWQIFEKEYAYFVDKFSNDWHMNSFSVMEQDVYLFREKLVLEKKLDLISAYDELFLFQEIGESLESLNNIWLDSAQLLNKQVQSIEWYGTKEKIWLKPYKELFATFIHVIRNAADHGIESPEQRLNLGKSVKGSLKIKIIKDNEKLKILFSDDGQGIDVKKIKSKIESKGKSFKGLSDSDIMQFIFDSNLSTRDEVSQFSGRGVGMDAVKHHVQLLGGNIKVESQKNQGTDLIIEVPILRPPLKLLVAQSA